jgi:hypothetical protein
MSGNKKKLKKTARERISQEIREDARCMAFFEPYREDDVAPFIEEYADARATLEVYGDYARYRQESIIKDYHEGAWDALKNIQYKKLFDLECQWRAEQVTDVRGVEISRDFGRIADNILAYDGISPISESDIQLYQQFLAQKPTQIMYILNDAEYPDYTELQERFRETSDTGIDYFEFHNSRTGKQGLLLLPDVRGQKEERYIDVVRERNLARAAAVKAGKQPPSEQEQYLFSSDEELIKFGEYIGDKKTTNFIRDRWNWMEEKPDPVFDWVFYYLGDISPEEVPVDANDDWKEGLYFAAVHHRNKKISELLPSIYEEYLMKKEMGMLTPKEQDDTGSTISEVWRTLLLEGRELLGEPRDFDF